VQIANYPPNLKYNNHMGKLHSLKRAIQRNPEDFFREAFFPDPNRPYEVVPVKAEKYNNKHFKKTHFQVWRGDKSWSLHGRESYRNFVKKVLIELGYKVYMRR
jgi:hypothetical protein